MLCDRCRRQVSRSDPFCRVCGAPVPGRGSEPLELVLPDGSRFPLTGVVTIGRAEENTVRIAERTVSRRHVRVVAAGGAVPTIEDVGSSHGTLVDGMALSGARDLSDGTTLRLGDIELRVERPRDDGGAARTLVVPVSATVSVSAAGTAAVDVPATNVGYRPKARSGYSLKRMDAAEGDRRWVLRNLRTDQFLRMGDDEAALFELLDGSSALPDLLVEAERRLGPAGIPRLARLLADLGERGFLEGVQGAPTEASSGGRLITRLARTRERSFRGIGDTIDRIYRRGGFLLFTRPGLALIAGLIVAGIVGFAYLVFGRYGTPFVVANKVGLGGLAFLTGRFLVVAVHELAHALTMASFGRRVDRAGVKLIFVFPFVFVDTSEAWFEPRRRRIAIAAAGPVADLSMGGIFALIAVVLSAGTMRDVFFQLALAGYVGAFFNLNPLLDRDGYHILVDALRAPGLRKRAREVMMRRLAGKPVPESTPRSLTIYGFATLVWMFAAIGFVIILSQIYYAKLITIAPKEVVWAVLGAFYLLMFVPVVLVLGRPLVERRRMRKEMTGAAGTGA
jgi:putative peptide zinc metalloprotease protein